MSDVSSTVWQPPVATLRLLGGVDLQGLDRGVGDALLAQPKLVALLAYLAIAGAGRSWLRRDTLVALLWPELDQAHARAALRKAVHALRAALGADALPGRGDEELRFANDVLACDVVEFTRQVERGFLAAALELYVGELLPGFHLAGCVEFDRWLDQQRTEARERAGASAWAMAQLFNDQEAFTRAGQWARKAVQYSWDDERTLRRALSLLDRVGDRAGALRLYDEFARRLRVDFDAAPSPETQALVAKFRA